MRGQGTLSQDWGGKAGIGRHKHQFGNRLLRGMIDEFYIFPCELPRLEILVLMRHCHVYFSKFMMKVVIYRPMYITGSLITSLAIITLMFIATF